MFGRSLVTADICDVHSHVLPDVDDGPDDIEGSLTIVREAAAAGVVKILCTPHVTSESPRSILDKIAMRFASLKEAASEVVPGVDLRLGAELMLHPDLPGAVWADRRMTINGEGRFALIEMPAFDVPSYAHPVFFDLLARGTTPIWAHPERCREVIKDPRIVEVFVRSGVMIQINAGSLLGQYGWAVKRTAAKLLKKGLAHICASDSHRAGNMRKRVPGAFERISRLAGKDKAIDMMSSTPLRVLG